jgi:hypothetical protein
MLAVDASFMYLASRWRVKARKFNGTPEVCLGLAAAVNRRFHAESH